MNEIPSAIPAHLMREAESTPQKNALGKDDFLTLFMTQLKAQDPLNPMKHEEFATQLAQFTSLEQLSNIGKGIEKLGEGAGDEQRTQALSMIGREVQASGNEVNLMDGEPVQLRFDTKAGLSPNKASIFDASGALVREISVALKPDENTLTWDGTSSEGKMLPAGRYRFRVHGVDSSGQGKEITTELKGKVVGIQMEGEMPQLIVESSSGKSTVALNKITAVSLGEADKAPSGGLAIKPVALPDAKKVAALSPPTDAKEAEKSQDLRWQGFPNVGMVGR